MSEREGERGGDCTRTVLMFTGHENSSTLLTCFEYLSKYALIMESCYTPVVPHAVFHFYYFVDGPSFFYRVPVLLAFAFTRVYILLTATRVLARVVC